MSKRTEAIKGSVKYGLGIVLLAYVLWSNWEPKPGSNSPGLKGLVRETPDWLAIVAIAGFMIVAVGFQIARWYYLVRGVDLPFTPRNAVRLGLVGFFYNQFLPGAIAGDFVKAYFIVKEQPARKAVAIATVVIDRLFGLFGLLLMAAVVGGGSWLAGDARVAENAYLRKIIVFSVGAVAVAVAGWIILGLIPDRLSNRIESKMHRLKFVGKSLAEVWFALRLYRQRAKTVYLCVLLSAASHTAMMMMFHFAVRTFPSVAADAGSLTEHFIIGPIGFIAQVFFPAPGGVGGAEAIFGYLYTLLGRNEITGVVGRLAFRFAGDYLTGALGYLVFLTMKKELPPAPAN